MDKKWNLQDIKPAGTMQTRNMGSSETRVPIRTMDAPIRRREEENMEEVDSDEQTERIPIENGRSKNRFNVFFVAVLMLGIAGVGFLASFLMRGAEVTVSPRFFEPNLNATFTAYKVAPAGELGYEVMTLEAAGERQVSASGQQEVNEQAKGSMRIYKSTPGTQRLIKNTRLQNSAGKIFRITESVVIPGSVDGNPGFIMADVFAEEPGDSYNMPSKTRFTVPGLESDPALFNAIYGENEDPITGGFSGKKFIIDEEQLATAKQALQMELRNGLIERLPNEQPANMTTFMSSVSFTYESLPAVAYGENLATIKERALLHIPLFKKEEFASYIAAATVPNYDGAPVRIENTNNLNFTYSIATTSSTNLANLEMITFKLDGRPLIVSTYDKGKLSTDLLGVARSSLNTVLANYPSIEKADVIIRPFWQRSFPKNINSIEIIESVAKKTDVVQ